MKNKIKIILVFMVLLLVTGVSAQTNYSFSISAILSSMPNGTRLPDGTIVKAELITTGGATHSTGPSGSGTPGPDIGGLFTGITLPAYVGDKTPTNFTKIQMANTQNADNGMATNCSASIGFRIYFDRPINSINFLAVDIDGVHALPNGNAEWVAFFGYNGNTYVPYIISGPTTSLTNQSINTSAANFSWRTLIGSTLGAAAAASFPNLMTIRRQTTNGGSGTPDDLNHQVLFTPPSSNTVVTDFFLMTGIWSVTSQANVQASGLSPIVVTISSDFGDAPDSYKTLLASGGASHGVVGTLLLGETDFAEPDGLPSVLADASIDDDGIQVIPPLTNNGQLISSYTIAATYHNNTGLPANYAAWIDWNNDGSFQPSEGIVTSTPAGSLSGTVNLTWNNVTLTNTTGHAHTYLRVRTTTQAITTSNPGGAFIDGEVEDYAIGLPAATPDFACFNVGTPSGLINILSNDITGNTIVPSTISFVNPGTATNLVVDGNGDIVGLTIPGEGVWKVNSSGQVTFEPQSGSVVKPTPIAYNGRDASSNISNNALITLTAASIPIDTTVSAQGCFPTTLTATASVPAGESVVWYDAAVGGNIVALPILSTIGTVTYYAQGNSGTCISPQRAPVTLTITAPPIPGILSGVQNICQGSTTTYTSTGDPGGTWSSSDTSIATVDATGIVTGLMPGTATITYTVNGAGGCLNLFATRIITIEDAPESGIITGNQNICVGGTSAFSSDADPGGLWESNDLSIATVNIFGVVTGVSRGTTTISYKIIQNGSCPVIPSTIVVTIIESNPGTLSGKQNVCVGETTTFITDGDAGGTWSTDNAGIATVDVNGVITGNTTGTATITYTVNGASGCPSALTTRTVTVNVNAPATAADILGNNTEICVGDTAGLTVNSTTVTNPIFTWYADQTTTTALSTGATYSPSPTLTTIYYVSVKGDAVCENDPNTRKPITVTVDPLAIASDITVGNTTICTGTSASLTASSSVIAPVFKWYADQTTTTALSTGATYNPSPTTTTTYYVSVSGNSICENAPNTRQEVVVNVNPLAIDSDITADNLTVCAGSSVTFTASSNVTTPVFIWYADQTTTTALSIGATYNPSPTPTSTTTYYVSVSGDGICENAINTRKAVTVTVNPLAQASDIIAADTTTCPGETVVLTASSTTVTGSLFKWYEDQTTTTALSVGDTYSPSPLVTTTYYVSVSGDDICENDLNTRKAVTVTMNPLATAADITVADQIICLGDVANLTATSAINNPVFIWYVDQTSTDPLTVGDVYGPSPTTTTTYYISVRGTDICDNAPNTRKAVTVTVNTLGLASDITVADAVICSGSSATLTASSTTVTTPVFIWYADQTTTTALSTGATYNPSPTTTTTYYVSVSGDGVCENLPNTREPVTVTVNTLGLASDITVADAVICSGSSATLTASSTTVTTPIFIWYADQTTTTALSTGAIYNPSPTTTTTYYVSVSGDGVCENLPNTREPVTVTVNALGLASDITVADAVICSGSSATLTASSTTVTTPVFIWYADQTTTTALSTGATYNPSPTTTTTYYVSVSGDGVCENLPNTREPVIVTVNTLGLASDITVADAVICSGSSVTLTASSTTVTTPVFIWYADQTTTTALSTGATYNPSLTTTTTYYVSVSGDGVCENLPNTREPVTVTVNTLGLASDITVADAVICSGSSVTLTASSTTVTTPIFIWYADQTTTTALSTGATYNPSPTTTTTYYVSVSGDGVCENLPNTREPVTVTANPFAIASDITASIANATICTKSSTTITATSSISNAVYNWYEDPNLTVLLHTGATFVTPVLTTSTSYYVTVQNSNICENKVGNALKVDVTISLCSDIALTKTVSNSTPFVGDEVDFTITITNFGPDDATGVSANDVLPSGYTFISAADGGVLSGNTITWPLLNIVAGASVLQRYSVKVNSPAGTVDEYKNVAQIITSDNFDPNSTPNNNDPTENDQDSVIITPIVPQPSIQIYKDGLFTAANDTNGDGFPEVNETITYTFSVKNTGNIRLENVKINDPIIGITNLLVTPSTLEPGQIGNAQVNYSITEADLASGVIYNSAITQGNTPPNADDPDGTTVNDISTDPTNPFTPDSPYYDPTCPDCTVVPLPNNPKIAIVKEVASFSGDYNNAKVGDVISYLFTVSNIGNTALSNVRVTDPLPGLSLPILDPANSSDGTGDLNANGYLDLNEKWLYRSNYTLNINDLAKGQVVNQALAEATGPPTIVDPNGKDVSDLSDNTSPTNEDNNPTVIVINGCQVIAHNAITPNGDSRNDIFKIDGIECYPQNTVEIYNRWGVIVFHTDGYDNQTNAFNGYSNGRAVVKQSAGLPTGTYYYIIKYKDSASKEQSSAGYLFLSMK